jgi:hypothetical protein
MSGTVSLWFQRAKNGDFNVNIRLTAAGFIVRVQDLYSSENYENNVTLETLDDVYRYVEILCNQVLNDSDPNHPFTYFQYSVPNFPSVLEKVEKLRDEEFYGRFCDALDFYWGDVATSA